MDGDKKLKHFIKQPVYKGGNQALTKAIYSALKYPKAALEHKTEGIVLVEYDIDYKGNVIDTRVLQGIGHGCDEEACRVVKLLKFDVPTTRGVRLLFHKKIKIQFKLPVATAEVLPPRPQQINVIYRYSVTATQKDAVPPDEKKKSITYHIKLG